MQEAVQMEEALQLQAEAKKCQSKATSIFSKLGGSSKRAEAQEEAEMKFAKAAPLFLEVREFIEAAHCFENASKMSSSVYSAASLNIEAARALRKGNEPERAAQLYANAIATFVTKGPQRRAASVAVELAEMYKDLGQYEYSLKNYTRGIMLYEQQHEIVSASKTRIAAADVAVLGAKTPDDYISAVKNYEKAAQECAEEGAAGLHNERYKLKRYFLKSGLCYLAAGDLIGIKEALSNKYTRWDRAFSGTIEFRLLKELVIAFDQQNMGKFEQAMFKYDSANKLDKWHLNLALKAKQQLNKQPQDELL